MSTKLLEILSIRGLARDSAAVETAAGVPTRPNPPAFAGPTADRTAGRPSEILARSFMVPLPSSYAFLALTPESLECKRGLSTEKRRKMQSVNRGGN
jgi:hypothetical protein